MGGGGGRRGYLYVAGAAVLWASAAVAAKLLFASGLSPLELVRLRTSLAALVLAAAFALFAPRLLAVRPRDAGYFLVLGGALVLTQFFYFSSVARIHVAAAVLLQYLAPALVAAFSILFWRERATAAKLLALLLAALGCYLVVGGHDLELLRLNRAGVLFGVASAVAFAAYMLLSERGMHRYAPWTVLFYALLAAALVLHLAEGPAASLESLSAYGASRWRLILYVSVAGTVAPYGLFLLGVNLVRSTRASVTATLEPVAAAVAAYVALGENLGPLEIAGGFATLAAVALLQLQTEKDPHAPARIRAERARRNRAP